jgi:hypothetical protein
MGLIELVVTVCALSLPGQCEDQHFSFSADMSLNQCVMNAQPYIAQWINEHPMWVAVRWRCDYVGSRRKPNSSLQTARLDVHTVMRSATSSLELVTVFSSHVGSG